MKKKLALTLALVLLTAAVQPAATAGALQATPTPFAVTVDGKTAAFDAYNIEGANYFKLRDLAYTLSGTPKQFGVGWDSAYNAIRLTSGQAYIPVGGEMTKKDNDIKTAAPTSARIFLDGKEVFFTAYTIDGSNYFKLRDIGRAFNFGVVWDSAGQTIAITTSGGYTADMAFDYSMEIASYNAKSAAFTTPAPAALGITVRDESGATGVVLTAAANGSKTDFYLNALAAGHRLTFSGSRIKAAADRLGGTTADIPVSGGAFTITPKPISADKPEDEIITVTLSDNTFINIHTVNDYMPTMHITTGTLKPQAGVYSFTVDRFLLRVSTEGKIVYYRNMGFLSGHNVENFKAQDTADGRFYTFFTELNPGMRGMGFVSGMYVVMDENYREVNYITLAASSGQHHTHGEGYLDDHEFLLLGRTHWISLSYTPVLANNLKGLGIGGGNTAYVQACIIQEVQDGKVLHEYHMTDYPELYAAAKENTRFDTGTGKTPGDYMDYTHINSIFVDPKDGNLLVSMRSQYALYKFDRETGEILWALGGDLNQFSGLDAFKDAAGNLFIGQHYAQVVNKAIAGDDSTITVFDNHTSYQSNTTRVFTIKLDETNKTAAATVLSGSDLDKLTPLKHWATHCASFEMVTKDSCFMGWGSNITTDMNLATIGTHALLTDYNLAANQITFELSIDRNTNHADSKDPCFSYRVYKNAD
jgi:hypothetical protein